jgi:serine/threonine-protein kinase
LVHRDIKPANVLIAQRSRGDHAFLTDFGVTSHTVDRLDTQAILPLGTVDYIAPEQAERGEITAQADIYSLGCVFFETLTGYVPFARGSDVDKLWAHVHEPPPALDAVSPGLSRALQPVLDRALAKDPDQRQRSAGELAQQARAALEG